jgi:hypothetical protein
MKIGAIILGVLALGACTAKTTTSTTAPTTTSPVVGATQTIAPPSNVAVVPTATPSPVDHHLARCSGYAANMGTVSATMTELDKSTAPPAVQGDAVAALASTVRGYQAQAADDSVVASHYGSLAEGFETIAHAFYQPAAVNAANGEAIKSAVGQVVGAELWRC